jgi:hypothetical protein
VTSSFRFLWLREVAMQEVNTNTNRKILSRFVDIGINLGTGYISTNNMEIIFTMCNDPGIKFC